MKDPNWTRDEHIIALDFYLSHSLAIPKIDVRMIIKSSV